MHIMIPRVIRRQMLERIPGERIPAMIIHGLNRSASEEPHTLPHTHPGDQVREASSQSVEEEAFKGVVVEGAVGVGDVEAVVAGVEGGVEVFGGVHEAVQEVLPGVYYADCEGELEGGDEEVVDCSRELQFPLRECERCCGLAGKENRLRKVWVYAAVQRAGEHGVPASQTLLRERARIHTQHPQQHRYSALHHPYPPCPDSDIVLLLSPHRRILYGSQSQPHHRLHDLLYDDIPENIPSAHVVALQHFCWSVEAVLREEIVGVDEVEEHRGHPVGYYREREGEILVGKAGYERREGLKGVSW